MLEDFSSVNGSQTGICKAIIAPVVDIQTEPFLKSMTGSMPAYHRFVLDDPTKDMNYHLSGYGSFYQEALVKFNGESIERYAGVVSSTYATEHIVYDSYRNMVKRGKTMPLEYLNLFSNKQQERISKLLPQYSPKKLTEDEIIGWIECPSLVHPGENVWVPKQLFFVGYKHDVEKSEKIIVPSFSTGTASHKTLKKALINAITEYLQIDAFVLSWYTLRKSRVVEIDNPIVKKIMQESKLGEDDSYDVKLLEISMPDVQMPIYMAILLRKDKRLPYMTVGTQGDLDAENGALRGIMEATAIISMNLFISVFDPEKFEFAVKESAYTDLDTNVYFYAFPSKIKEKDAIVEALSGETVKLSEIPSMRGVSDDEKLEKLIQLVAGVSEYAVYLDITPPEVADKGWSVVRVFIPEICGMCLPGMPFEDHPRVRKYGGIKNAYPHPLP